MLSEPAERQGPRRVGKEEGSALQGTMWLMIRINHTELVLSRPQKYECVEIGKPDTNYENL